MTSLDGDKLIRVRHANTPRLPLLLGESRACLPVGKGEVFLRETPTRRIGSVALCGKKTNAK